MNVKTRLFILVTVACASTATTARTTFASAVKETVQHQTARFLTAVVHTLLSADDQRVLVERVQAQRTARLNEQIDSLNASINESQRDADHLDGELSRILLKNTEACA